MERIAIICSGGDCQGMNACIKTIVRTCETHNIIPIAVNRGYAGLIENDMSFLNHDMVENIDNLGGAFIKVSRSKEFTTPAGLKKAVANLKKNKIDGVIILGGNGSFKGAENLVKHGINVIAIPATIDNDLFYTDRSLGFDTAVNNAVNAIDSIRQTISATDRGLVVEVMGRDCGAIALNTAFATCAHALACKELNTTIKDVVADVKKIMQYGITSPVVVVSENCDFRVADIQNALEKELKIVTRSSVLGYLLRGGAPSVLDRILAINFGITAVELLISGQYNLALGTNDNKVFACPLAQANKVKQHFDYASVKKLRKLYNLD